MKSKSAPLRYKASYPIIFLLLLHVLLYFGLMVGVVHLQRTLPQCVSAHVITIPSGAQHCVFSLTLSTLRICAYSTILSYSLRLNWAISQALFWTLFWTYSYGFRAARM